MCNVVIAKPTTLDELADVVSASDQKLSSDQLQVATKIISAPEIMAFGTARSVADRCGTSPSTLMRLATSLGFASFRELRKPFSPARLDDFVSFFKVKSANNTVRLSQSICTASEKRTQLAGIPEWSSVTRSESSRICRASPRGRQPCPDPQDRTPARPGEDPVLGGLRGSDDLDQAGVSIRRRDRIMKRYKSRDIFNASTQSTISGVCENYADAEDCGLCCSRSRLAVT
ncbi:transcriptional regulator, RpiR family [Agrobacterium fabrum]|uniref:Transcriptional regulator, RpiR family n=1 Tax=Agrobacterium fabrum TaxID=1176649 RepID=A0A7Z7FU83_9HYPH|nr:transcriptional regulator, RpiR family [Agrobacterium fabrum]SDK47610.1 transcriptional regulator, RpiR family [Agrobacterium fabrum]SES19813.1 transcriptional regulator, RpiR family [Agrobacterium fabrum]